MTPFEKILLALTAAEVLIRQLSKGVKKLQGKTKK